MATATPRPKRSRRRWIVAGLLLFMASVAGWWFSRTTDARFLGKWEIARAVDAIPVVTESEFDPVQTILLRANGTACIRSASGVLRYETLWKSEGDQVVLGLFNPSSPVGSVADWLVNSFNRLTGRSINLNALRYELPTGPDGTLVTKTVMMSGILRTRYRRLPE